MPKDVSVIDWSTTFESALPYDAFLTAHGTEEQRRRWASVHERVVLTEPQRTLIASFARRMPVLCLAGAWCGDCVNQGPVLETIASAGAAVDLRFLDRDEHRGLADTMTINAGQRVPVVIFLSEDFHECARYGERTLATYRKLAADQLGPSCPTGIVGPSDDLLSAVVGDWLREFERISLMLRLSPRLREKHGD
jgi:hypothetical protein